MIPNHLETATLSLRPFLAEDAGAVFEYWRSDAGWERYNASVPPNFSLADAKAFVRDMRARDRDTSPSWAILLQGRVIGVVSITFEQGHRFAVIGYGVHGDLRGQGLSAQAASRIISEAFDRYPDLRKIRAHTDAENTPSIRVLEKLGFSHEGTLRKNQYVKGNFVDEAIYGLLREDWDADTMDVANKANSPRPFEGAAFFYARYRPDYPSALWDRLAREASLDSSSVVVDLGCGSGAAALALAPRVAEVVGVDPDGAMLAEAKRRAASKGLKNVRWVRCRAESFEEELRDLALIVAASSFHWMDRHGVAELGRRLLRPGGVFAVAGNPNPIVLIRQRAGVGAAIAEVQDRWFGDQPELAPAALVSVEDVFRSCHFKSTETLEFPTRQRWTVDRLLGLLCSTSLPPNQRLGDRYTEFAADIERAVLQIEPSGSWLQEGFATLVLART